MKNEEVRAYVKTLFAVLASVCLILVAVWWYWNTHSVEIMRKLISTYKDSKVQEDIGEVLGEKVLGAIIGNKKK